MQRKQKLSILCLDDQPSDLELQRDVFETHGYSVSTATTWAEAQRVLFTNRIDVVMLDYRLPASNAVDVAIEIRKRYPRLPIILLSGYTHDIPEYFKHAVDGCIAKSSSVDQWVNEIRRLGLGELGAVSGL